jgi:hypothetical protein
MTTELEAALTFLRRFNRQRPPKTLDDRRRVEEAIQAIDREVQEFLAWERNRKTTEDGDVTPTGSHPRLT